MGKRYHCDYCDKGMVSAPSIVKTHNRGVIHQKLVQDHYKQFKDPETILAEESTKKPCGRFPRGECSFGSICRFSHYSREQIDALREYVATKNKLNSELPQSFEDLYQKLVHEKSSKQDANGGNTVMYDNNGLTHTFPWTYNPKFEDLSDVPPSIKKIKIEDFVNSCVTEWG